MPWSLGVCFVWGERRGDVVWFVAFERGITFNVQENGWTPFVVAAHGSPNKPPEVFQKAAEITDGDGNLQRNSSFWVFPFRNHFERFIQGLKRILNSGPPNLANWRNQLELIRWYVWKKYAFQWVLYTCSVGNSARKGTLFWDRDGENVALSNVK